MNSAKILALIACVGFAGCSYLTLPDRPPKLGVDRSMAIEGVSVWASDAESLAAARRNTARARVLLDAERKFYSPKLGRLDYPRFGIALSGGGSRAAAFSLGVLSALTDTALQTQPGQEQFRLEDADLISSVSGGGYANYFMHTHAVWNPEIPLSTLLLPGPRLSKAASRGLLSWGWTGWSAVTPIVCLPFNILGSPFPSVGLGWSCGHGNYTSALWGGYDPGSDLGNWIPFSNRESQLADLTNLPHDAKSRRPFPIFAATALVAKDRHCSRKDPDALESLHTSVVEFTPLQVGSEWLGYKQSVNGAWWRSREGPEIVVQLRTAAAISGAALDGRQGKLCKPIRALGYTIGSESDRWAVLRSEMTSDPITGESQVVRRAETYSVAFVDGGETENLGAYPLIKRMTQNILIVDSGFDPEHTFPSYWCLKRKLARQGLSVVVPEVESKTVPDGVAADARDRCVVLRERGKRLQTAEFRARSGEKFGYTGRVTNVPHLSVPDLTTNQVRQDLNVLYVKLGLPKDEIAGFKAALNERYLADANAEVRDLARRIVDWMDTNEREFGGSSQLQCRHGVFKTLRCPFPMVETTDQNLGYVQYMAYYFLGRYAAERHAVAQADGGIFRQASR